jgi:O-antigen/teichoic acid export membrane protein
MRPTGLTAGLQQSGTVAVTTGLVVQGVTTYGFLTVAARGMSEAEFSVVAALWSAVFALANGLFSPLEQETTRAVAERVARGERLGPVIGRVVVLGTAMVLLVAVVLTVAREPLSARVFSGRMPMVAVLAIAVGGAAAVFLVRGILAGTRRYWTYAAQLAGDGTVRLLVSVFLVAAGAATAVRLGAVLAVVPILTLAMLLPVIPRSGGRPRSGRWSEVTANLGWLVLAAVGSYGIANAGPIVLQVIGGQDPGLAGRFLAAFVVVRIPLFFTSALQASLLPRLVTAVEDGDDTAFVAALGRMVAVVGGLGSLVLAGFAVGGPQLVSLLFGARYQVTRFDVVVLGASSVLFVLATLMQQAALALGGHRAVAVCWSVGAALFTAACLLPLDPVLRLETGYLVSGAAVLGLLSWTLVRRRLRPAPVAGTGTEPVIPRREESGVRAGSVG